MANIIIKRTVSLDGPVMPESMAAPLYQQENQAHQFEITCTRGGSAVTLTGSVQGRMIRADGQTVAITGSISGGKAVLTLPQSAYVAQGRFVLAIINVASGVTTVVYSAMGNIARTTTDTVIDPGSVVPDLTELLAMIDEMETATAAAEAAATKAVRYDTTQSLTAAEKAVGRGNIGVNPNVVGTNVIIDVDTVEHSATVTGGRLVTNSTSYLAQADITIENIPQDDTTHWLVADLNQSTRRFSVRIVDVNSVTFGESLAFIGYTYNNVIAAVPGIHVFNNGLYVHGEWDTWTEYGQNLTRTLTGPKRMLIIDMSKNSVYVPDSMEIITGNKTITTSEQTINISGYTDNRLYIAYDSLNDNFIVTAGALNRNRYMIVALITRSANYVDSVVPYILITDPAQYYDVCPEVVVYGDSVVAGAGGVVGFENIVAAKAGIRMLNRGIGSTGYITRVASGTNHLVGNDTPERGTMQDVNYANNNIVDRITAEIGNITQNIIAIMAGTNDVATSKSVTDIISAVETCIDTIQNAGKIPVIISPIRRENVNLTPFYTALKEKCIEVGVHFIDVFNIGFNPENTANKAKYLPDGIHPSDTGYYILAAAIADGMKKICMVDKYY